MITHYQKDWGKRPDVMLPFKFCNNWHVMMLKAVSCAIDLTYSPMTYTDSTPLINKSRLIATTIFICTPVEKVNFDVTLLKKRCNIETFVAHAFETAN